MFVVKKINMTTSVIFVFGVEYRRNICYNKTVISKKGGKHEKTYFGNTCAR